MSILGTAIKFLFTIFSLVLGISTFHHIDSYGSKDYPPHLSLYKLPLGIILILKRIITSAKFYSAGILTCYPSVSSVKRHLRRRLTLG